MVASHPSAPVPRHTRPTPSGPRFQAMNGLRLLSAVLIVVFHAASAGGGTGLDRDGGLGPLFSLLDLGVPVFFALSGFLLYRPMVASRLTGAPRKSVGRYAWHRFRRILPAYWVVLGVAALLGQAELGTGWQPWRIAGLLQVYDAVSIAFGLGLVVAWSLCTEVSFYAYLPVHDRLMRISRGLPGKRVVDEWIACARLGGERALERLDRKHPAGRAKNRFGESLHAVHVGEVLRWAEACPDGDLVDAFPRSYPSWARPLVRVPGLREVATWNLAVVLRVR